MNEFEKQLGSQPLKSVPTEWRAQILKEARAGAARDVATASPQSWSWLRELLWPCPQAWGALAAVWIVIAAFQFITPGVAPVNSGEFAKNRVTSVSEQRRELTKLLEPAAGKSERSPADRPRSARSVHHAFV